MGLDMYFDASRTKYESALRFGEERKVLEYPTELSKLGDYINERNFQSITTKTKYQIGYFRKFNALHSYIVDNFADGVDDCREIVLSKNEILEISDICKQISQNHALADDLLPTQSGFFFGSTEYDEYYFSDIEEAIKLFDLIIETIDFSVWDIIYQASW